MIEAKIEWRGDGEDNMTTDDGFFMMMSEQQAKAFMDAFGFPYQTLLWKENFSLFKSYPNSDWKFNFWSYFSISILSNENLSFCLLKFNIKHLSIILNNIKDMTALIKGWAWIQSVFMDSVPTFMSGPEDPIDSSR